MMRSWYEHTTSVLGHSSNLGTVREHFIQAVLENFLPKTVIVGRGEIIDGRESGESGQQDVILYRADFPVITSHTSINTYLIEGVIATIEVKSNLSKEGLSGPFQSAARVKLLEKEALKLPGGEEEDFKKLQAIHTVKTFVVGYEGWKKPESLVENYRIARELTSGIVPDAVYYPGDPGFCVLYEPGLNKSAFVQEFPFAVFFQALLRSVMSIVSATVRSPGINAEMKYTFNRYLSLNRLKAEDIDDSKFD
ncbi:MAG: DUF6602 domain-containing protein [Vibrio sp.]